VERAHAPFWLPPPHYSTEDFVYNGLYIPKNTALILNCYEIHHNEERYPDPYAPTYLPLISFNADKRISYDRFSFKPERFLGDTLTCAESNNLPNGMDRDHWTFGAGYVVPKSFLLSITAGRFRFHR
jgi:Cytochrome P450